jgi:hypothetical protein
MENKIIGQLADGRWDVLVDGHHFYPRTQKDAEYLLGDTYKPSAYAQPAEYAHLYAPAAHEEE